MIYSIEWTFIRNSRGKGLMSLVDHNGDEPYYEHTKSDRDTLQYASFLGMLGS
ncbi:hypothetical protein D3C71_2122460 [compost metagenome]